MTKRDNASTGRRPAFTLSEEGWQAIRSTRKKWPEGVDWRREIEQIGRDCWEAQATREKWRKKLQGKNPAKQRGKIRKVRISMLQSQKVLAELADDGLLDDNFPYPNLKSPEQRLEAWLSDYDLWVRRFAGQNNPIQLEVERRLMNLWKRSGGKLRWSRKKDDPGTPYGPLVDFLTLTLDAILGKALKPSGVAKLIDRHRGNPFLMYVKHARIAGLL